MEQSRIGEIEEILINAFPAVEREIYDGWILNFSGGYTYRANCIYPFYHSGYDLEEKVIYCENQYRELLLPTVYKMTAAVPEAWTVFWRRGAMKTLNMSTYFIVRWKTGKHLNQSGRIMTMR